MEYSFENFTILDKKKNGKADKIHFTVLEDILLRCDCVGVDLFDGFANTKPDAQVCKDLYDASLVCERRLLQNREVFHHAIVYDVLDDLVHKVNLSAVEVSTIQILREFVYFVCHSATITAAVVAIALAACQNIPPLNSCGCTSIVFSPKHLHII